MIGAKGNDIYFSAASMEPEMHPLMQVGMSMTPYALMYGGARYAMQRPLSPTSNMSYLDAFAAYTKEKAARAPLGLANTFRIPELLTFFTSATYKGMEEAESELIQGRKVGRYVYESSFFKTREQRQYLEEVIGKQRFADIKTALMGDDFRIILEQDLGATARSRLLFQEIEQVLDTSSGVANLSTRALKGSTRLLSENVFAGELLNYAPEILDVVAKEKIDRQLQPIASAAINNLNLGINPEDVFRYRAEGDFVNATVGFFPSTTSPGLKNKLAVPTAYLTFGQSRFNKLIKTTFEQVPIFGKIAESTLKGMGLSPYTAPGPFYKQFVSLGLKASAIGAAYMGVRTIDHYRRNFGLAGHLVASTAISTVGAILAKKALETSAAVYNPSLPKKVGLGLFALQMMPGFSQGIKEGIATTLVNADIIRSYVGKYTGMSGYRRTLEGLMPGFTDPTVGAYAGLALVGLSYAGVGKKMIKSDRSFLPEFIKNRIGFFNQSGGNVMLPRTEGEILNRRLYDLFMPRSGMSSADLASLFRGGVFEKYNQFNELLTSPEYEAFFKDYTKGKSYVNMSAREQARFRDLFQEASPLIAKQYGLSEKEAKIVARKAFLSTKVEARLSFFEEYVENNPLHRSLLDRLEEIKVRYQDTGVVGGLFEKIESFGAKAYHAFFGASLSGDTYEEGVKSLGGGTAVRRAGALFFAGFLGHQLLTTGIFGTMETPQELHDTYSGQKLVEVKRGRFWEGGGTPYAGMETNYFRPHQYHMLMTQADEKSVWGDDHDIYNPITKFFLKNFTYYLEEKNYYDRPYPITAPAFESLPVIGPLLGATIGSLIKPTKFMHEDEFLNVNAAGEVEFAYREEYGSPQSLGGLPPGKPITPNNLLHRYGQIQYQTREIEGITGYAKNLMQKVVTGRETLGTMMPVMEDSGRMDSSILNYWDMELGGAFFLSEPIRRLLPRPKAEQERYNPIMNSMPSWLPDRFKRGDPYRSVPMGHARLPGKGYEALYPELEGMAFEDYPLIHKYKILSDVAPKSSSAFKMQQQLFERRASGATTDYENAMLDATIAAHRKRLSSISDFNFNQNAIVIPGLSNITSSAYKAGEQAIRAVSAPAEYLIPGGFRPSQKLLGATRGIVETYEYDQLYGTPHAFWDAPIRDWIRPSMYSALNMMGFDGKPLHVQRREEVNEHFDKLQFIKFTNLAQQATNPKDRTRYLRLAARTRTGVNPQGNALGIYMSLPDAEKKYFDAFASANENQRERILEMMPEDQRHLYQSLWSRIDTGNTQSLYNDSVSQEHEQNMLKMSMELQQDMDLPGPDWVGWHKDVDLEDIKLRYISSLGEDIHDYNKFSTSLARIQRRPYLENSEMFVNLDRGYLNPSSQIRQRLSQGAGVDFTNLSIYNTNINHNSGSANLTYNYDRSSELGAQMLSMR